MLALEKQPDESVPLDKIHRRWWISRLYAHYSRFHLWGRAEIIATDPHKLIHFGK